MKKQLCCIVGMGILAIGSTYGQANAAPIDLSTWEQWGDLSAGNWVVSADHTTVTQTINGQPTYFVSDQNYLNTTFEGSFGVHTTSDDDFIGFIFGAADDSHFYLFDWKQADQYWSGNGYEGFTLSRIDDTAGDGVDADFWGHSGDDLTVLATDYGSDKGWADNTDYNFVLDYTSTSITISIDGNVIFDLTGMNNNPDGRFGFYNYSQGYVVYQGFEQTPTPSPVPEPATMLLFGTGLAGLAGIRRRAKK